MKLALLERCSKIRSPGDLVESLLEDVINDSREITGVVCLNIKNKPIAHEVVSIGTLSESFMQPREVFRLAIEVCAASIIVVHNHPSGDVEPSREDVSITQRLVEAGEILGIEVLDHIIVNERREYFSFREAGLLNKGR
ncbi:JAB domain-containing protein [Candidatus Pyrohabitans sp.]